MKSQKLQDQFDRSVFGTHLWWQGLPLPLVAIPWPEVESLTSGSLRPRRKEYRSRSLRSADMRSACSLLQPYLRASTSFLIALGKHRGRLSEMLNRPKGSGWLVGGQLRQSRSSSVADGMSLELFGRMGCHSQAVSALRCSPGIFCSRAEGRPTATLVNASVMLWPKGPFGSSPNEASAFPLGGRRNSDGECQKINLVSCLLLAWRARPHAE